LRWYVMGHYDARAASASGGWSLGCASALGRNGMPCDNLSQRDPRHRCPYRCAPTQILTLTVATLTMASPVDGKNFALDSRWMG